MATKRDMNNAPNRRVTEPHPGLAFALTLGTGAWFVGAPRRACADLTGLAVSTFGTASGSTAGGAANGAPGVGLGIHVTEGPMLGAMVLRLAVTNDGVAGDGTILIPFQWSDTWMMQFVHDTLVPALETGQIWRGGTAVEPANLIIARHLSVGPGLLMTVDSGDLQADPFYLTGSVTYHGADTFDRGGFFLARASLGRDFASSRFDSFALFSAEVHVPEPLGVPGIDVFGAVRATFLTGQDPSAGAHLLLATGLEWVPFRDD